MDKILRSTLLVSYFVIALFALLLGRLFYMQVLNYQQLGSISTTNSIRRIWVQPPRGRMIDRNGVYIVDNQPLYTVKIVPFEFKKERTAFLAWLMQKPEEELREIIRKGSAFNRYSAAIISRNLDAVSIARVSENLWQLPGVLMETDNKRLYPDSLFGSHLFGYLRSIPKEKLEELADQGYTQDDKIGFSGLEKFYEEELNGQNGMRFEMVTPHGKYAGR